MAGLLDTIKQQLATPGAAPELGQTEQVGGLLRAKLGKQAAPSTTPAQSTIGEQLAQQETRAGLQDIARQGQIVGMQQGEQAADARQREQQQKEQSRIQLSQMEHDFANKSANILDDLRANQANLSASQRMAKMEQAGFLARGANENYVKELKRQGQLNRLQNDQEFKYEAARNIFANQEDLLRDDLKFRSMMDADARSFEEALANMSDDFALKMGDKALQSQAAQAQFSAVSGLGSAAIRGYTAYAQSNPDSPESE